MVKIAKCLRCHNRWEIPVEMKRPERCNFCKEINFIQVYESITVEEKKERDEKMKLEVEEKQKLESLKGGKSQMAEQKKEAKVPKEKKKTITEQRDVIAKEALEFIKSKVEDKSEVRKIHSRMYRILIGK